MKTNRPSASSLRAVAVLTVACALLAGCATNQPTTTGYLSAYDALKPVAGQPGLTAQRLETWSRTARIAVAPVAWSVPVTSGDSVSAVRQQELTALAASELTAALTSSGPAGASAPAAELRAAITRVEVSNPAVNVVSTIALFAPLDNGGICVEWQLVEPATNRILARGVAVQTGKPWNFKSSFTATGHAALGLKKIAGQIATYLNPPQGA